jgi:kynureninase
MRLTEQNRKRPSSLETFRKLAEKYDAEDGLARFRNEFVIDDPNLIYMDGNSLGRLPKRSVERAASVVSDEWGRLLIRSWGINWYEAPRKIGAKIARLIGAQDTEVIVSDSTTNNLFKVVMAALMMQPGRKKIVSDEFNFPSDLYILQGCSNIFGGGYRIDLIHSEDGITIDEESIEKVLDSDTAVLVLSHVVFKSGFLYDAARITDMAHKKGILVVWDLSHSVGSVPVNLDAWNADFAIGCTYKYLNGGPGAPAFLYVNHRIQKMAVSPIWGWFGDGRPFNFDLNYQPGEGINRFLVGTPNILSLLTMEPGVDLLLEAGMDRLREKSLKQTSFLIELFDLALAPSGFTLGTPREPCQRGSHVSIRHPEGYRINLALINDMHVLPDFRVPDNIRLGIAPMYTRFVDIWEAVDRISRVMDEELYKKYSPSRQTVT